MSGIGSRAAALTGLALVAGLAPTASANVRVMPDRVMVKARGATATIERQPFRLAFKDGRSRTRLRHVENRNPSPRVITGSEVEPLGLDNLDGPTLYAPLAFKVGVRANLQIPAAVWVGNQLAGLEAGTMYSAREVIRARRVGRVCR